MQTEKLFELLTLVNGVSGSKWETVRQLVDLIAKDSVTIKSKEWNDKWKQNKPEYYPLDLSKIETWSTYDKCVDLQFSNDTTNPNNQLVCKAKIYDGDNFDGFRTRLRFEALLWLPSSFIHEIEPQIEWAFETFLEDAYENHLETQKKLWINNMKNDILKFKPRKKS